jgi:hypothetical protein
MPKKNSWPVGTPVTIHVGDGKSKSEYLDGTITKAGACPEVTTFFGAKYVIIDLSGMKRRKEVAHA